MYSKTRFRGLLEGLPRGVFDRFVSELGSDKYSKGFSSWDHFVVMLFGQLSGCQSLRELETSFNAHSAHHYHLGTRCIKRSTLSDANGQRDAELFARLCAWLMQSSHRKLKQSLRKMLYLMDSTSITLKGLGYDDWALQHRNNVTQGIKLHLMLEGHTNAPIHAVITGTEVSDIKIGRQMPIEKKAVYVFDKGYYDYNWWHSIDEQGSMFLTRFKKNVNLRVIGQHADATGDILEDAIVTFNRRYVKGQKEKNKYYGKTLRRITVRRPDNKPPLVLVTNNLSMPAEDVAALYKKRWDIELFFKWVKQNLKIKRFLGRSENAVRIQIYIALIGYLLLQSYRRRGGQKLSLKLCLSILKTGMFERLETTTTLDKRRRRQQYQTNLVQPEFAF